MVMDWSADLFGLDRTFHLNSGVGGGVMQGSACDSALVAIIAARIQFQNANPSIPYEQLVLYVSSQTHSLGMKTVLLLGLQCRILPVKPQDQYALRGQVLLEAFEEDRALDRWPFALSEFVAHVYLANTEASITLVATVGTTNSGTVDRLDEIGPIGSYLSLIEPLSS